MKKLFSIILILFLTVPAWGLSGVSTVLYESVVVQQDEITTSGTDLLETEFNLRADTPFLRGRSTRVLICTTFRWLSLNNHTTRGDRVAIMNLDGEDVGTMMMADSGPEMLWQSSNSGCYSAQLIPGPHIVKVRFGGCCGFYGNPFVVGAGSRIDILW